MLSSRSIDSEDSRRAAQNGRSQTPSDLRRALELSTVLGHIREAESAPDNSLSIQNPLQRGL